MIGPTDFRPIVFWPNDVASLKNFGTLSTSSLSIHMNMLEKSEKSQFKKLSRLKKNKFLIWFTW